MTSALGIRDCVYEAGEGQPHAIGGVAIDTVPKVGTDSERHEIANQRMNFGS